ncbi:hypothetical protein CMO83_02565 [Candidatus Woesearchaeota archaeon]|jgi:hypothetical protein|nr:hypothetical protein [Candidatus Woesearchaeota archaeon]MDP6647950.1 hypothetical protein [Candidatus Woesearchaeota archaeon]|tara:strand:- start:15691 stop:16581 length:891 start_codon:yes stop_codon:yes gene_type:complete
METRDKILEIVHTKGPVLPVQVSKEIGSNILMASAHLAELTANGKLRISTIKVGGSPLYFLQGQEVMLEKYTGNMNDKEKKAFDLLNENKILRDSEQTPVMRVALREIKDFAIPFNVNYNDSKEIFWKWYIIKNEEAEQIIKSRLDIKEKRPEEKIERKEPKKLDSIEHRIKEPEIEKVQSVKRERKPRQRDKEDGFMKDLTKYFEKNKINVIHSEVLKKNSEIDFIVEIPSVVGNLQYYCKAKNKKRVSDSDLSNAYVKGQFKKLPVIFISPGELSTKAKDMMSKELNNITFKKV